MVPFNVLNARSVSVIRSHRSLQKRWEVVHDPCEEKEGSSPTHRELLMIYCWFCTRVAKAVTEEGECCRLRVPAAHTSDQFQQECWVASSCSHKYMKTAGRRAPTEKSTLWRWRNLHFWAAAAAVKAHVRLERKPGGSVGTSEFHLAEFSAGENNNNFDCFAFSALKCS